MSLFELNPKMNQLQKRWKDVMLDKFCKGCIIIIEEEDVEFVDDTTRQMTEQYMDEDGDFVGDFVDLVFENGVLVSSRRNDYSIRILEEW